ncbi:hypothetical protein BDV3_001357 [Batrachochytrium dendrobatidis]|nr:hypothetical protein O5D80_002366 [Batrachochytrium dendrobatidis]KAK5668501.1 hypothetical protein QVD99_005518 [Batrachochytrium dendrobatidis]
MLGSVPNMQESTTHKTADTVIDNVSGLKNQHNSASQESLANTNGEQDHELAPSVNAGNADAEHAVTSPTHSSSMVAASNDVSADSALSNSFDTALLPSDPARSADDIHEDDEIPLGERYHDHTLVDNPQLNNERALNAAEASQAMPDTASSGAFPATTLPATSDPIDHSGSIATADNEQQSRPTSSHDSVQGFQLVQATGLTDTCTPSPKGSSLPTFATASPACTAPIPTAPHVDMGARPSLPITTPTPPEPERYNPLLDNSKSKQFNQRLDYMISEFFTSVFQQRVKERLGSQWAHITSQPEVDEAVKQVQDMYDFFARLEKMVERQMIALQKVNDIDVEMYLFYQQQCFQESFESIRKPMMQLSLSYKAAVDERAPVLQSYEQYLEFLRTFKEKAIGDALETMKKQQLTRLELDSYGSRLGQLEEKKLKAFAKAPGTFSLGESTSAEKELNSTRQRFHDAKNRYQSMSTQMIDKSGLLIMKRDVDFSAHIRRVVEVHDWFCRGFRAPGQEVSDSAVQMPKASTLNGFGSDTMFTPPQ